MKRAHAQIRRLAALGVGLWLACACALHAQQEGARQFTGDLITGYSGATFQGDSTRSPYVGLEGDFNGYVKNPRILTYDFAPNFVHGFQWVGPLVGPSSNGFGTSATFLGGSFFPLTLSFSRQNTPTPDFGLAMLLRPTSTLQQQWAADWALNLQRLPTLTLHYGRTTSEVYYPEELDRQAATNSKIFTAGLAYRIVGWSLSGSYTQMSTKATGLPTLSFGPGRHPDRADAKAYVVSATRELPLNSRITFDYSAASSKLNLQNTGNDTSYNRWNSMISSRPISRLDLSVRASYLDDYSDYLLQNQLNSGSVGPLDALFATQHAATLNGGVSASFRIKANLQAWAGYNAIRPINNAVTLGANQSELPLRTISGKSDSYSAGINYNRRLFGGRMAVGYGLTETFAHLQTDSTVTGHSLSAGYDRLLPWWHLEMTSNGSMSLQRATYQQSSETNSYNLSFGLRRKLSSLLLDGRFNMSKMTFLLPNRIEDNAESFSVSVSSARMAVTGFYNLRGGLTYLLGDSLVAVPGAPSLPFALILSNGHTMGGSGAYRFNRHLNFSGQYTRGAQSTNDVPGRTFHAYQLRGEYKFRRVRIVGGYGQTFEDYLMTKLNNVSTGFYYIQLRRDFRLF